MKKDIYREENEIVEWVAFVKQYQDKKAVMVKLGKFSNWLSASNKAKERFGDNQVVLVEPE